MAARKGSRTEPLEGRDPALLAAVGRYKAGVAALRDAAALVTERAARLRAGATHDWLGEVTASRLAVEALDRAEVVDLRAVRFVVVVAQITASRQGRDYLPSMGEAVELLTSGMGRFASDPVGVRWHDLAMRPLRGVVAGSVPRAAHAVVDWMELELSVVRYGTLAASRVLVDPVFALDGPPVAVSRRGGNGDDVPMRVLLTRRSRALLERGDLAAALAAARTEVDVARGHVTRIERAIEAAVQRAHRARKAAREEARKRGGRPAGPDLLDGMDVEAKAASG